MIKNHRLGKLYEENKEEVDNLFTKVVPTGQQEACFISKQIARNRTKLWKQQNPDKVRKYRARAYAKKRQIGKTNPGTD